MHTTTLVEQRAQEYEREHVEMKNKYVSISLLEEQCSGNEILEGLLQDMFDMSMRYTETVCRFEIAVSNGDTLDKISADVSRHNTHESTIDSINVLARTLKVFGIDSSWIRQVSASGRAGYGKFAITTAFELLMRKEDSDEQ